MEILSASIPENLSEGESTRDRSVCFSISQSASSLLLRKARPKQFGPRCIATNLVPQTPLWFSPIFTNTQGTKEGRVGKVPFLVLIAPTWKSQTWYTEIMRLSIKNLLFLPQNPNLLRNHQWEKHTPLQNETMRLAAWIITGNIWLRKEFQKGFQTLSFHQE